MLRFLILLFGLALAGCATLPGPATATRAPVTLIVSIDGFSPDYLDKGDSPVLDRLAAEGVRGAMRPSFPSKTFPNHYTLVTGLRPDRHGVVGNNMIDPRRPGVKFSLGNAQQSQDPFWWNEAEPIWVTAEKQGVRTATMFWPGADVAIHGTYPSDWARYYEPFSYAQRVRTVRDWLSRADPAERPRLLTLYFEDVDTQGHHHGPGAPQTRAAVRAVDQTIGQLLADAATIGQPLNLLIVSDHGMARIGPAARFVQLDDLLPRDAYLLVNSGALVEVQPAPGRTAQVERALLGKREGFQCWRKGALPARLHYGRNPRVPAIVCQSDTGWEVVQGATYASDHGGDHGFDPADPAMRALFIANGPAFARGVALPDFDNIHLYPLLARVAGVRALPGDGDPAVTAAALAAP